MENPVIKFTNVWEMYRIKFVKDKKVSWEDFWALKDMNFSVDKGETLCIIGENGAGKSTILKLIAGMIIPDKGQVNVKGRVSALMELGAGFHPHMTGRENILFNAGLYGLSKEEMDARIDKIIEFAGIGKFIDAPIKCYSQGMYMRLAFSLAIHVDPDILLIDDILAVGDALFQAKCIKKIFELKEKGITIIFVTHDINLANMLCERGIVLKKGEVIKDGPIEEAASFYNETIASYRKEMLMAESELIKSVEEYKEISVSRDRLEIICYKGKLKLYWDNDEITKDMGLHTSIQSKGVWYNSDDSIWKVRKAGDRSLEMRVIWNKLPIVQVWKLELLKDNCIRWDVDMEVKEELEIDEYKAGLMLPDRYSQWLTAIEGGRFEGSREWQDIELSDTSVRCIGLRGDKDIPNIFLKVADNASASIQSSPDSLGIRTLQSKVVGSKSFKVGKYKYFSGDIDIVEDRKVEKFIADRRREYIESNSIGNDKLKLLCSGKKLKLYWGDNELTKDVGLWIRFICLNKTYSSQEAIWKVESTDKNINIVLKWEALPVVQIWKLDIEENYIDWRVDIEATKQVDVWNREVKIILSDEYSRWFTQSEHGKFMELNKFENHKAVFLKSRKNYLLGVRECNSFPGVGFVQVEEKNNWTSVIYKKWMNDMNLTYLSYLCPNWPDNINFNPGKHSFFKGKILFGNEKEIKNKIENQLLKKKRLPINLITMRKSPLNIKFKDGKGRLFWKNKEITTGLGMYTSIFSDTWHDSTQASWKVIKKDKAIIIITGYWPLIPITQIWEVKLENNYSLVWKVSMEVFKKVRLEREQTNLMLSSVYNKWIVPNKAEGKFPDKFNDYKGLFWDRMWSSGVEGTYLEVESVKQEDKHLPGINFSFSGQGRGYQAVIENTDPLFSARVLQFQKLNLDKASFFKPGKYSYFKGRIRIKNEE